MAARFWENAVERKDRVAFLTCRNGRVETLRWEDLGHRAAKFVMLLQQKRIARGGHVASCLPNSLEWILFDVAAQTLGLVHVAIDAREPPSRQRELVEFSEARCVLHSASGTLQLLETATGNEQELAECLAAHSMRYPGNSSCRTLADSVEINSAAQMLFTSGSIGNPKGVLLSHRNLLSNSLAKLEAAPQGGNDLRLNILPFSHAYARTCELSSWILSRGQLALATGWDDLLQQACVLHPTLINLVPYLAGRAAEALDRDRASLGQRLRLLQVGGAALGGELWNRLYQHGLPPLQGYGLTEAAPVVCSNRAGRQRPGTVGPPVNQVEVRVDDESELWCRGPNVMLGYWRDEEATSVAIKNGWLRTDDLAELDDRGHVRILGRLSQQIVLSTGYKVSPEQVERELHADEWIERAVVFGDGLPHVIALIWPTADGFAEREGENWRSMLSARIAKRLRDFPHYAIPTNFHLMTEPLAYEEGTLTFKGAPRRAEIAARHWNQIRELTYRIGRASPTDTT